MTSHPDVSPSVADICASVKRLGYGVSQRIRLYGEEFEVISDPFRGRRDCGQREDKKRPRTTGSPATRNRASECERNEGCLTGRYRPVSTFDLGANCATVVPQNLR